MRSSLLVLAWLWPFLIRLCFRLLFSFWVLVVLAPMMTNMSARDGGGGCSVVYQRALFLRVPVCALRRTKLQVGWGGVVSVRVRPALQRGVVGSRGRAQEKECGEANVGFRAHACAVAGVGEKRRRVKSKQGKRAERGEKGEEPPLVREGERDGVTICDQASRIMQTVRGRCNSVAETRRSKRRVRLVNGERV